MIKMEQNEGVWEKLGLEKNGEENEKNRGEIGVMGRRGGAWAVVRRCWEAARRCLGGGLVFRR